MDGLGDDMKIPKYCATCTEEDEIVFCGTGDSAEDALNDFIDGGDFEDYCSYQEATIDDDIDVFIYSTISIKDSDWGDDADPKWVWCLDEKLETRTIRAA